MADPSRGTTLHVYSKSDNEFVVVVGVLDSGVRQDWISRDLVASLGLTSVSLAEPAIFEDFQGATFAAHNRVKLRWHGNKSYRTREGYFFVAESGPFDILIGSDFLFSRGVFTFHEAALLLMENPKSEEDSQQQIEQMNDQREARAQYQAQREDNRRARASQSISSGAASNNSRNINDSGNNDNVDGKDRKEHSNNDNTGQSSAGSNPTSSTANNNNRNINDNDNNSDNKDSKDRKKYSSDENTGQSSAGANSS